MKTQAMQVTELGHPMQSVLQEVARPLAGEIQIDVLACSLNFADTLIVQGTYQEKPALPFSPGMEVVGKISAIGSDAQGFRVGQKIMSYVVYGGMARRLNIPQDLCIAIPDTADPITHAALPIAYGTSHLALFHRAKLKAGETLLVLGASGGVGLTAVELGAQAGANVIACASSDEKLSIVQQKGAHHLVNTTQADIKEVVKDLGGADVVYDPVGGEQFKSALRACKPEARILPLGFASGEVPQIPANIILVKNISVLGFYWGGYRKFAPDILNDSLAELATWLAEGKIAPHIGKVFALDQANEAIDFLKSRKASGKVVIDMTL